MKNTLLLILMFCGFLASAQVTDLPVTATPANILSGGNSNITTTGSQVGYTYFLRDDSDNSIIAGPIAGTGNDLTFNTGVLNSTTTYNVYAENNSALDFTSDYNYINLSNDNRGIDKEVSIAVWVKTPSTLAGLRNVVMDYGSNDAGFILRLDGYSATISGRDNTGNFKTSGPTPLVVTNNVWRYVVGTINVTTGDWKIYVDGNLQNSLTGSPGNTLANTDNLYIGNTFSTSDAYRGEIMNVTIWNKELSAFEITTNMNNCLLGSENNVIGHFPLSEGTGNTVNDYSSLDIDGTLSGGISWIDGNGTCRDGLEMTQTVTVHVNVPEPTVEMTDATTALFSWNAIPNATSYQVKYRLKNTTAWSTSGTSNTQRNVPNLTAKKYYQYKVRSQNSSGVWSSFSDIGLFYTSACDVPTGIASIYLDNARMRIRWDNNPDEIKAKVRYREVGTSTWYTQNSADGNNYIYINGLTPNAEYQYRVRSNCDGNDWSEYSASYFHNLAPAQRIASESVSETKIYPNPARDVLFVEFDNENAEQVNITIIDGLGKTIQSSMNNTDNGTQQIDISQIPNGYYFISIQKENSVETLKFLKVN